MGFSDVFGLVYEKMEGLNIVVILIPRNIKISSIIIFIFN
jgi:hypothetical protein